MVHPDAEVRASALYAEYKRWCEDVGENIQAQRNFGMRLGTRPGLSKRKAGHENTITWFGLGLKFGGKWDHLEVPEEEDDRPTGPPSPPRAEVDPDHDGGPNGPFPLRPDHTGAVRHVRGTWSRLRSRRRRRDRGALRGRGEPTRVRSRCDAPRHGHCDGGTRPTDEPPHPAPDASEPLSGPQAVPLPVSPATSRTPHGGDLRAVQRDVGPAGACTCTASSAPTA